MTSPRLNQDFVHAPATGTPRFVCRYRGNGDPPQDCNYPECDCAESPWEPVNNAGVNHERACSHCGADCAVLRLVIPADLSYTGVAREKDCGIDACIAPIVKALNDGGVPTIACCCGHSHRPGTIALGDGRELIIAKDFAQARAIDASFPDIYGRKEPVAIKTAGRCGELVGQYGAAFTCALEAGHPTQHSPLPSERPDVAQAVERICEDLGEWIRPSIDALILAVQQEQAHKIARLTEKWRRQQDTIGAYQERVAAAEAHLAQAERDRDAIIALKEGQ